MHAHPNRTHKKSIYTYNILILKILPVIAAVLLPIDSVSRNLVICSPEKKPLAAATAITYSATMDSLGTTRSDTEGRIDIDRANAVYMLVEHHDYSSKAVRLDTIAGDTIALRPATALKEIEVEPDMVKHFLTHDSYRLPARIMERYRSPYQALNEIPHISVFPNNAIYFRGKDNVKLLINGVESDYHEVAALPADDIDRINVYSTPPLRYATTGVDAVVEVVTKSNLRGGNAGVDIAQAFKPLKGNNSLHFNYNYRRSRFKVAYSNYNEHYRKMRRDENLAYDFGGQHYIKNKTGVDSRSDKDNNGLSLTFQNNLKDNYLVSLKAGFNSDKSTDDVEQVVHSATGHEYPANNQLQTASTSYWTSVFVEKTLGHKGSAGTIAGSAYYQRVNSDYDSRYMEWPGQGGAPATDVYAKYRTSLDAAIADIEYSLPIGSDCQFAATVYETYKYGDYTDNTKPFRQKSNELFASARIFLRHGKFSYNLSMCTSHNYSHTTLHSISQNKWHMLPRASIHYYPTDNMYMQLNYTTRVGMPALAELSETDQWVDTRLIYHGNAGLVPYHRHILSYNFGFNSKYLDLSFEAQYLHAPHTICEYFVAEDDHILQTLINLERYDELYGMLNTTLKPLGSYTWIIVSRLQGAKSRGRGLGTDWSGYRFQWHLMTNISLKRWNINASYQYPGKVNMGQRILPRAQHWDVSCWFNIAGNLWAGAQWTMPFGKRFRERQYTVPESLVHYDYTYTVADRANYVSLNVLWNVSFGKNQNRASQNIDLSNDDTGILRR